MEDKLNEFTKVSNRNQSDDGLQSLIFTILEHCDNLLKDFEDNPCFCAHLKPKFEKICVKVIELHRNYEKKTSNLPKQDRETFIDSNSPITLCDNFSHVFNLKNDHDHQDFCFDLNKTFVVDQTSENIIKMNFDREQNNNEIKLDSDHENFEHLIKKASGEKLKKLVQEISDLKIEIKEIDETMHTVKSLQLNKEFEQIKLRKINSIQEKYSLVQELSNKSKRNLDEDINKRKITDLQEFDKHIVNDSNNIKPKIVRKKQLINNGVVAKAENQIKNSSSKKFKCSCKKFCCSQLCSCRKNGVGCSIDRCNCNPETCKNKDLRKAKLKRMRTFTVCSMKSQLMRERLKVSKK